MRLDGTLTQLQSVVATLPSVTRALAYYADATGVITAGLVEVNVIFAFTPRPSEASFTAAFPSAVAVLAISEP